MTLDSSTVTAWVDLYIRAWNSNDPAEIGALVTDDAAYYTGPFDAPWTRRDAIVREWLARQDAPGSTTFRYAVLATTSDSGIIRGWTQYHDAPGEFSNIWLARFDPNGRCREFTEGWVQRRTA